MAKLNVMKAINDNNGKINRRYSLSMEQISEIVRNSTDRFYLIYNFFAFGYIQGMKAAKAEMRNGGKNYE